MNRTPPSSVRNILRREVNYGCPIPDCGSPLLTWHHFDPPWHIEQHYRPEGIIALCTTHHPMADVGTYSVEQLHAFKENPNSFDSIKNKFEWYPEKSLIRLGGCWAFDRCRIIIENVGVLEITKDDEDLTSINFLLEDENHRVLAEMENNFLVTYLDNVHDISISASANRIKLWSEKRKVGFECHYSRKSPEKLERLIANDCRAMSDSARKPAPIENLEEFYSRLSKINEFSPEVLAIAMERKEMVEMQIRWHAARHMGADKKIPVIDFVSCKLCSHGYCVELRNGKMGNLNFCGGNQFTFEKEYVGFS